MRAQVLTLGLFPDRYAEHITMCSTPLCCAARMKAVSRGTRCSSGVQTKYARLIPRRASRSVAGSSKSPRTTAMPRAVSSATFFGLCVMATKGTPRADSSSARTRPVFPFAPVIRMFGWFIKDSCFSHCCSTARLQRAI